MRYPYIYVRQQGDFTEEVWGFKTDPRTGKYVGFGSPIGFRDMLSNYIPPVGPAEKAVTILLNIKGITDSGEDINVAKSYGDILAGKDVPNRFIPAMMERCEWEEKDVRRVVEEEARVLGLDHKSGLLDDLVTFVYGYPALYMDAVVEYKHRDREVYLDTDGMFVVFPIFSTNDVRFVARRKLAQLLDHGVGVTKIG